MKLFLLMPVLFFATNTQAKNYYLSSTGSDANTGLSPVSPWETISKLNGAIGSVVSGDSILFKRGDSFYGTLNIANSGTISNPIVIAAYGTGAKPIITGLTTISSWASLGSNIWEATVPAGLSSLNMVIINGVLTPMGRFPNANAVNGGYKTYTSFVNLRSITDPTLSGSPSWTNAELVVRQNAYVTRRTKIITHSGTTLSFSVPNHGSSFTNGYGYFIENSLATLDQDGEWFYDTATKKIKIYYSVTPPNIQVSNVTSLVSMLYNIGSIKYNVTFKDISFIGCEGNMIDLAYCYNFTIDNCDLRFAGKDAIESKATPYLTIKNCNITDVNNMGIRESATVLTKNVSILNNTMRRVAIYPGMLTNDSTYNETESGSGIALGSKALMIRGNTLDSVGYCSIRVNQQLDSQIVRRNIVSNFCFIKSDGSGIYNSGLRGNAYTYNNFIDSNIVYKSLDAVAGSNSLEAGSNAIYLDATSTNVQVLNNTVFDCHQGIFISQAQDISIKRNTVYNTGVFQMPTLTNPLTTYAGALSIGDGFVGHQHTRNNTITNNIFFAKTANQLLYYNDDNFNGEDSIGIIDSNYYVNPSTDFPLFVVNQGFPTQKYSLKSFKLTYPVYNANSFGSSLNYRDNSAIITNGTHYIMG